MNYLPLILSFLLITSQPSSGNRIPSQRELSDFINLKIEQFNSEQLSCDVTEYYEEGQCRSCDVLCTQIDQYCVKKCPGYPYVVGKKNQQKQNEMLHQEILKNRTICIILIMFISLTVTSLLLYQLFKYFNHEKEDEVKVDLEGVTVPLSESQETVSTAVSHRTNTVDSLTLVSNNHTGVSRVNSENPNTSGGEHLERRIHSQPTSDD